MRLAHPGFSPSHSRKITRARTRVGRFFFFGLLFCFFWACKRAVPGARAIANFLVHHHSVMVHEEDNSCSRRGSRLSPLLVVFGLTICMCMCITLCMSACTCIGIMLYILFLFLFVFSDQCV